MKGGKRDKKKKKDEGAGRTLMARTMMRPLLTKLRKRLRASSSCGE